MSTFKMYHAIIEIEAPSIQRKGDEIKKLLQTTKTHGFIFHNSLALPLSTMTYRSVTSQEGFEKLKRVFKQFGKVL